jgi:hypothetical protein
MRPFPLARAGRAVAAREVAALAHELRDDAVEGGALEVERLAAAAHALLARAQSAEVLPHRGATRSAWDSSLAVALEREQQSANGSPCSGRGRGGGGVQSALSRRNRGKARRSRRRTSAVLGTTSARSVISMRPAGAPPMVMSKKTIGVPMVVRVCGAHVGGRGWPTGEAARHFGQGVGRVTMRALDVKFLWSGRSRSAFSPRARTANDMRCGTAATLVGLAAITALEGLLQQDGHARARRTRRSTRRQRGQQPNRQRDGRG